jgi:hypothetical protein
MSQQQAIMSDTLRQLVKELQKPPETNTLDALEKLLKPLVQQLAELSRKLAELSQQLPEPPNA